MCDNSFRLKVQLEEIGSCLDSLPSRRQVRCYLSLKEQNIPATSVTEGQWSRPVEVEG